MNIGFEDMGVSAGEATLDGHVYHVVKDRVHSARKPTAPLQCVSDAIDWA